MLSDWRCKLDKELPSIECMRCFHRTSLAPRLFFFFLRLRIWGEGYLYITYGFHESISNYFILPSLSPSRKNFFWWGWERRGGGGDQDIIIYHLSNIFHPHHPLRFLLPQLSTSLNYNLILIKRYFPSPHPNTEKNLIAYQSIQSFQGPFFFFLFEWTSLIWLIPL